MSKTPQHLVITTEEIITKKTAATRPTKELLLAGTLDAILEVGHHDFTQSNGIIGPGYESWTTGAAPYTKIKIHTPDKDCIIEYEGIILPDSIGNPMQLHQELHYVPLYRQKNWMNNDEPVTVKHGKHQLHDLKLDRWYL